MILCIRDEAEFLAAHLTYHRALGVERAYIFLDRCTDGSGDIARAFDWVTVIVRDRDPDDRFMSAHQVKCINEGLQMARADDIDWLMHIDPDEFACGDSRPMWLRPLLNRALLRDKASTPSRLLAVGNLPAMLAQTAGKTEQVILPPKDVIPTPQPGNPPFWQLHHFQHRGEIRRRLLDPTTGEVVKLNRRLGHYKGKTIVRTAADVEAISAHRWGRPGRALSEDDSTSALPSATRGLLYHYVVTTAARWLHKHRKFAEYPATWEKGNPVFFPKQAWKEASLTMNEAEAKAYFDRWIAVSVERMRGPMLRGEIVRDPYVEEVLRASGFFEGNGVLDAAPNAMRSLAQKQPSEV